MTSTNQHDDELLLESLDRHFMVGCKGLTAIQLDVHKRTGACRECHGRGLAAALDRAEAKAWDDVELGLLVTARRQHRYLPARMPPGRDTTGGES